MPSFMTNVSKLSAGIQDIRIDDKAQLVSAKPSSSTPSGAATGVFMIGNEVHITQVLSSITGSRGQCSREIRGYLEEAVERNVDHIIGTPGHKRTYDQLSAKLDQLRASKEPLTSDSLKKLAEEVQSFIDESRLHKGDELLRNFIKFDPHSGELDFQSKSPSLAAKASKLLGSTAKSDLIQARQATQSFAKALCDQYGIDSKNIPEYAQKAFESAGASFGASLEGKDWQGAHFRPLSMMETTQIYSKMEQEAGRNSSIRDLAKQSCDVWMDGSFWQDKVHDNQLPRWGNLFYSRLLGRAEAHLHDRLGTLPVAELQGIDVTKDVDEVAKGLYGDMKSLKGEDVEKLQQLQPRHQMVVTDIESALLKKDAAAFIHSMGRLQEAIPKLIDTDPNIQPGPHADRIARSVILSKIGDQSKWAKNISETLSGSFGKALFFTLGAQELDCDLRIRAEESSPTSRISLYTRTKENLNKKADSIRQIANLIERQGGQEPSHMSRLENGWKSAYAQGQVARTGLKQEGINRNSMAANERAAKQSSKIDPQCQQYVKSMLDASGGFYQT